MERKGSFRGERNARAGAREEGGKETPARRPLFPPTNYVCKINADLFDSLSFTVGRDALIFRAFYKQGKGNRRIGMGNGERGMGNL